MTHGRGTDGHGSAERTPKDGLAKGLRSDSSQGPRTEVKRARAASTLRADLLANDGLVRVASGVVRELLNRRYNMMFE
jgi:hypothetical protein